ncbi:hypothetical protein FHS02_002675 [Massilia umbonata]|uniref:Uncharacterized protein n=1 Tax=Pseudoduganella umbonata TaxID=864828 RepID=A0A7W5EBK8_9BURK|nr:hypothetical protein [Pseudoduganella umbonata]
MFPKPPRPEPPRRAVATQVVQQRVVQRVPDTLVAERPAGPPASAPLAPDAPAEGQPL